MVDQEKESGGAWGKVPTWDGSPQTWRAFQREMRWWPSALDLESTKKYNLAARWLLRQQGVVRQRGEEFLPDELAYQKAEVAVDLDTGAQVTLVEEDPLSCINKLLKALEDINGRTTLDKRGELRHAFYLEIKRRPGERIAEFCARFRTAFADLRSEGVNLPTGEVGWFFKSNLGFDPLRVQPLDTALLGAEEYESIEREVLRLFKELHVQDPLVRKMNSENRSTPLLQRFLSLQPSSSSRATSYAQSQASSAPRSFRSSSLSSSGRFGGSAFRKPFVPEQAMVSEIEEGEQDDDVELFEAEEEGEAGLEDIIRSEAEALAAELDESAENGLDASMIQEIEDSVETAAEALITMKEARSKLQEVKKDRGYGRAGDGPSKVSQKKASGNHPCFDCLDIGQETRNAANREKDWAENLLSKSLTSRSRF